MRDRCHESGHALLLALFALVVLLASLLLVAHGLQLGLAEQRREVARLRLDVLIDGVVDETLGRLAQDPEFAGVSERPLDHGRMWSTVQALDEGFEIVAGASLGRRRAGAVARAREGTNGPRIVSWRRRRSD